MKKKIMIAIGVILALMVVLQLFFQWQVFDCPRCEGMGAHSYIPDDPFQHCGVCSGDGRVSVWDKIIRN